MKLELNDFVKVLSLETSWLEAHPIWILLSAFIYASLAGLFINAIRMSIKFERIHEQERRKTYGRFSKDVLILGLIIAIIIFIFGMYQRL